jgi:hypothetical protein
MERTNRLSQIQETLLNALEKGGKVVIEDNKLLWMHLNNMKNGGRTFEEIIEELKKEDAEKELKEDNGYTDLNKEV